MFGLYSVLWGKYKEYKEKEAEVILEPVKGCSGGNNQMVMIEDMNDEANDIEMQKAEIIKSSMSMSVPAVAIIAPIPQPPMIALEAPKT